jgi:hypothetical protein
MRHGPNTPSLYFRFTRHVCLRISDQRTTLTLCTYSPFDGQYADIPSSSRPPVAFTRPTVQPPHRPWYSVTLYAAESCLAHFTTVVSCVQTLNWSPFWALSNYTCPIFQGTRSCKIIFLAVRFGTGDVISALSMYTCLDAPCKSPLH